MGVQLNLMRELCTRIVYDLRDLGDLYGLICIHMTDLICVIKSCIRLTNMIYVIYMFYMNCTV